MCVALWVVVVSEGKRFRYSPLIEGCKRFRFRDPPSPPCRSRGSQGYVTLRLVDIVWLRPDSYLRWPAIAG